MWRWASEFSSESVVHIRAERTAEKSWIDERDRDLQPVRSEKEPQPTAAPARWTGMQLQIKRVLHRNWNSNLWCSPCCWIHCAWAGSRAAGLINSKVNERKTLLLFAPLKCPLYWENKQTIHHNCDLVSPCQQNRLNQLHKLSAVTRDA